MRNLLENKRLSRTINMKKKENVVLYKAREERKG